MFENEAEDNKPLYACCSFNTHCELWKDGFQKGAEFGYNKAEVVNLINKIKESEKTITISEYFDNRINKAKENYIKNWFMELKCQIEEELKKYADEHSFPIGYILRNNRVERTENGLIVLLGKKIKYKDKIFEIYFPSEFNNNFVLARSIFLR